MKKFEIPEIEIVYLSNEDVIIASSTCDSVCRSFKCNDCGSCSGAFSCMSFDCYEVFSQYGGGQ